MTGYTPDEKLRLDQLRALRRQWLKDQELSPREPVLPPEKAFSGFWHRFLQKDSVWRRFAYKAYGSGMFLFVNLLIPAWIVHYYVKYHVEGDTILETGEVIPPMKEHDTHNHH
ncbi:NADH dehydrogenase [ubiquinone] 1 beta subcomplex subunit 6 isoform X2 [Gracilinanus agilis]|uniref:NADH dehydrogenase [ubiquinone] 1 beta subcomplex subunit 6 isoform X2 n=1 Tax=Gracilinanus agilis TaxID=191870 RepID=UPI001CFE418F|nr:NADH dehydrogenase [ubiquinone] 1 beta subcomplex subunit 6 isoform X2 [Gracilinanus agilis]